MTIPFLNFFKKKGTKEQPVAAPAPVPPVEKPSSERLSKTVMPNATRPPVGTHDPFGGQLASPAYAPMPAPAAAAPRTISFGSPDRQSDLPPAVALALEPRVERTVSLELADIVRHMPAGLVRELSNGDGSQRVLLKASELEKGMARGKPSVSLSAIFQQVPEVFTREIASSDLTEVMLPIDKVLEQFNNLQIRSDQADAPAVPQVETPFLKVTLEDDVKFGTKTEFLKATPLPPVRLQPATAETIAAAEPEATAAARFVYPQSPNGAAPLRISIPAESKSNGTNGHAAPPPTPEPPAAAPIDLKPASSPTRIPFKLTPTGTDVPAPERVPASRGPSVPNSPAKPGTPTRIPFKVSATPQKEQTDGEPWLTKESFENGADAAAAEAPPPVEAPAPEPAQPTELTITLTLKPILQSLPPFQLVGDINSVPKDARIELPFALIEPQLASGRVVLNPADFGKALPEEYRSLFNGDEVAATISLPLQEVLKNLPTTSLRMRDDQIEPEKGADFATPFSAKAEEDAKRLKVSGTPVAKPTVVVPEPEAPAPPAAPAVGETPVVAPKKGAKRKATASAPVAADSLDIVPDVAAAAEPSTSEPVAVDAVPARTELQKALDTDDELDAKTAVAHIGKMPGVKACAIMFGDGLSLAGNLPEEYEADGLCAMAPSLLQRIENHMIETKLGELRSLTLSCAKAAVTFFMHGNLCLAALHAEEELASDVRERLARAVHALSIQYSNPA